MDSGLPTVYGWRTRLAAGAAAFVLLVAGLIWAAWHYTPRPSEPTFCTADGFVTADGTTLSRDHDLGCEWVGPDGERWALDDDGNPTP